jgi:hypothetical protein
VAISLLIVGALFVPMGATLLYGSLHPRGRWDSWWERSAVIVSGFGWLAMGGLFIAAALASGGTRTALVIAGGAIGLAAGAARWLIRDRWEVRQISRGGRGSG